ncbi:MAG: hypothetical protein KJ060_20940 [Candidatus Hydrogenedentes bacterium]|nr:hypothetical protein [Candidatus Hydrogenedentota bacterium]
MTRGTYPRPARGVLVGAVLWMPILLVPFSAFFFETWLQLQIFERDYEAAELSREIRETNARIEGLEERADELMTLDRISEQAPDLGLVQPEPSQIEVVRVTPGSDYRIEEPFFEIARLPAAEPTGPPAAATDSGVP